MSESDKGLSPELVEAVCGAICTYAVMYQHETVTDALRTVNQRWTVYKLDEMEQVDGRFVVPESAKRGVFTEKYKAQKECGMLNARAALSAALPILREQERREHLKELLEQWKCSSPGTSVIEFFQRRIADLAPGHTDLMVTPESLDEYLNQNPLHGLDGER